MGKQTETHIDIDMLENYVLCLTTPEVDEEIMDHMFICSTCSKKVLDIMRECGDPYV